MRFLVEVTTPLSPGALRELLASCSSAGADGVLLTGPPTTVLLDAASAAGMDADLLIAVELDAADRHPVELAEELVVVDQVSRGRLIVVTPSGHLPDPAVRVTPAPFGDGVTVWSSARARRGDGWRVLAGPAEQALTTLRHERPRNQLGELPHGLENHWESK